MFRNRKLITRKTELCNSTFKLPEEDNKRKIIMDQSHQSEEKGKGNIL